MKLYIRKFKEEQLFEMANLSSKVTGLDEMIWISYKTGNEKHGARIKVKVDNSFIPISISDDPQIMVTKKIKMNSKSFNKIKKWIVLNQKELLTYWDEQGSMGTDELLNKLKKV